MKYVETVSALACEGSYRFAVGDVAGVLRDRLASLGFRLDRVEFVDANEVVFYGRGMILSVCRTDDADHDVLVAAETPVTQRDGDRFERLRLLLCATASRLLCETLPVRRISWWHKGDVHVTEADPGLYAAADRHQPDRSERSGLAATLSAMAGTVCAPESPLGRMVHRHFPSESDIVLATGTAA